MAAPAFLPAHLLTKARARATCAGVFPPERGAPRWPERPGRPQQADGERGEGFLRGASSTPEAAEGGRDGQTGTAGHAGLGPGKGGGGEGL